MLSKIKGLLNVADGILITSQANMRYYSGFTGEGAVLITSERSLILTDSRYTEQAAAESNWFEVLDCKGTYYRSLGDFFDSSGVRICFEEKDLSYGLYQEITDGAGVDLIPSNEKISRPRMVKEKHELEKIRRAAEITDNSFSHILGYLKEGVRETDIALELEFFMRKNGAEKVSFDIIAASGENSSKPHAVPGGRKLRQGDFLTMDFGCVFQGYCSDMTRTVVVGKADDKQREIYGIVLEAQEAALDMLCSGVSASLADKTARDIIERKGYGKYFGHSLGHGVGLEIHELPNLAPRSDVLLGDNMVVTVEPGIYIPGFGGVRIEDMVYISGDGIVNFVHSTKELIEV